MTISAKQTTEIHFKSFPVKCILDRIRGKIFVLWVHTTHGTAHQQLTVEKPNYTAMMKTIAEKFAALMVQGGRHGFAASSPINS